MLDLSVVIPVRNEEENLYELVARLTRTLETMGKEYELIFVTDINTDNTFARLKEIVQVNKNIKAIKLSNSYGQHIAAVAGLKKSIGQCVVIMDGDLQDLPEDIPSLYGKLLEGYDVVYGIKEKKNESSIRNFLSTLFNLAMSRLSDTAIEANTSMFRIVSRRTVEEILRFSERQLSLTHVISLINFPTATVRVNSGKRFAGKTNYGFFRQLNMAIDTLLSFSTKPLRLVSAVGIIVSALSLLYFVVVILQTLFWRVPVMGWPTIVGMIALLSGIQLFGLGIIGEYIGRIFIESKKRPLYIIEEEVSNETYEGFSTH